MKKINAVFKALGTAILIILGLLGWAIGGAVLTSHLGEAGRLIWILGTIGFIAFILSYKIYTTE